MCALGGAGESPLRLSYKASNCPVACDIVGIFPTLAAAEHKWHVTLRKARWKFIMVTSWDVLSCTQ